MSSQRSLSIVIPNYNGVKLIPKFMPSVIKAYESYKGEKEIIVVDDASPDNSLREIKKFPQIRLEVHGKNQGFSATCNTGLKMARHDIVFFLNTDVELEPDFFNYFSEHFSSEKVFAVTPLGFHFRTREPLDGSKSAEWKLGAPRFTKNVYEENLKTRHVQTPYPSYSVQGAYFFATREKLLQLGGFDPLYSPFIFEETDMAYRALKRGWRIHFEPKCKAYHDHSQTIQSVAKRRQIRELSHRNRLIFTWKNIHSKKLLLSHAIFCTVRLATLNLPFWKGFLQATRLWPEIKLRRQKEIQDARVTDEQIFRN